MTVVRPWKIPVPAAFWDWARWMISGRKGPRPASVAVWLKAHGRRTIPTDWYVHLAWIRGKPRPKPPARPLYDLGIYGQGNGYMFTHPGGDAELAVELVANGFTWALFNIDDIDPGLYSDALMQAKAHGLITGPWARVRNPTEATRVEEVSARWNSPILGHNLETESETTLPPPDLQSVINTAGRIGKRLIITEGWTQNDPKWSALQNVIGMPETFLNVNPDLHPKVCCDHTSSLMNEPALPLFGAGPMSEGPVPVPPDVYKSQWPGVYCVYPGNGIDPRLWGR